MTMRNGSHHGGRKGGTGSHNPSPGEAWRPPEAGTLLGGQGNDTLTSDVGTGAIDGGAGFDVAYIRRADTPFDLTFDATARETWTRLLGDGLAVRRVEAFHLVTGAGDDRLAMRGGNDTIWAMDGADTLAGGAGRDLLVGGAGNDVVIGGGGGDHLSGDAGDDLQEGGAGNDFLVGGIGTDTLVGGSGADLLWSTYGDHLIGGRGKDTFFFAWGPRSLGEPAGAGPLILDFAPGVDTILLHPDAFGTPAAGTDIAATGQFVAHASDAPTTPEGLGQFIYNTATGVLWWDADGGGAGAADHVATLIGAPPLAASDIALGW